MSFALAFVAFLIASAAVTREVAIKSSLKAGIVARAIGIAAAYLPFKLMIPFQAIELISWLIGGYAGFGEMRKTKLVITSFLAYAIFLILTALPLY